jgi:DNA-binding MarR family transcriptional regulator
MISTANYNHVMLDDDLDLRIAQGLGKIGLALRHKSWESGGEQGLTPTQAQILTLVVQAPRRPSDVADHLALTRPTVSNSVAALVAKGLVEKHADSEDARATWLHPTRAGRRRAAATESWTDFLASAADALTPAERESFYAGLVAMIRTLQERGAVPLSGMCTSCVHFEPNAHPGAEAPHHCRFVDAPLAASDLRLDCPDQERASEERRAETWERFRLPLAR